MPPRVLLLARENVLNWTPLYVAAFRRHAEVLAVGPALDRAALASVGLGHAADFLEPNDFCTDSDDAEAIVNALPAGWRPDFVVAVQSGAPRYRNLTRLALSIPTLYPIVWCNDGAFSEMAGDKTAQWLRPLDPALGPRYLQIVDLIGKAVGNGVLRAGDRLPPQRRLADLLDVDLTTVTRAYQEARQRNLLDAVTGRGSFVSAQEAQSGPAIDLSMNIPPAPKGVRLAELMQRGISEILAGVSADRLMTYQAGTGSLADRAAGCAWLEPAGC